MGKFTVLDGGLFTTIQDLGRFGFRKFGVPVSGVMDESAYISANGLVDNPEDAPVLECTLKGGKYRFDSNAVIAITGALMGPKINGTDIDMNTSHQVYKDDILELGFARKGCRSYIAIKGKWKVSKVMGSYSTYTDGNFGGLEGRKLQKDDMLKWENLSHDSEFNTSKLPKDEIPYYSSKITLDFVPGPEWDYLKEPEQKRFLNTSFQVSSKSNRMGIRLKSEHQFLIKEHEMISSGVIPGIIQMPPIGQPIVLMKDGQTIGGYPRIGKVLDTHLGRLSQIPPNGLVRFKKSEGF